MTLKIVAKSEPRDAAKGQFQCQISDDAVTLSRRKKQITIPVGAEARYVGKNRIDVTLPDYRLELLVTKFGSFQNRLAKDLAAFLSGQGDRPVVTDYAMPWYFFVVSALPLGIPILTLGGVLPAVIGFGLSGACFGIVQNEERSVQSRLLAAGALVFLGYLALFAVFSVRCNVGWAGFV